jgi:hypothetical protein
MDPMIKLVGTIQPVEKRQIHAEGADYEAARAALDAEVPEGWQLISISTDR